LDSEVSVWRASLSGDAARTAAWWDMLSPGERTRAERLRLPEHRAHFIAAHGQLREVLGSCLATPPEQIEFRSAPGGKPVLDGACAGRLKFSMSHSGGVALYAVAKDRRVGVDIERIRPGMCFMEIAWRFYSPREYAELESLPDEQRGRAFFQLWTRKEACAKASGRGLSVPFEELADGPPPGWSLRDLDVGADYAAAVVAEGRDWRLQCRPWP
jgi:4'-phosphopantetheinyl transferase